MDKGDSRFEIGRSGIGSPYNLPANPVTTSTGKYEVITLTESEEPNARPTN